MIGRRCNASEIKVRAERKAGELLAVVIPHDGGRPEKPSDGLTVYEEPPRLADLGITRNQSSQWQQVAAVPEPVFEEAIREVKADGKGVTTAAVMRTAEAKIAGSLLQTVSMTLSQERSRGSVRRN